MATPATPAVARTAGPLDGLRSHRSGPPGPADDLVREHLRLLGAATDDGTGEGAGEGTEGTGEGRGGGRGEGSGGLFALAGTDRADVPFDVLLRTGWGATASDEATAQAVTGVMAVHGRRDGAPRGLAVDYAAAATGVLAVQGVLAALLAQARGGRAPRVEVDAERAALLTVSQYLAAAGAEEGEAAELAPGGPPFTSADGVVFELETLDPGAWAAFWRALDAPEEPIRRGWRPFQFRYATACAPFPPVLHATSRAHTWERIRQAADASGAEVCRLRSLAERAAEYDGAAPWSLRAHSTGYTPRTPPPPGDLPLAGFTVLEAGRRIQAPLAAHLLGLLGAEVVRIEPPGGDPLRGMPPACSGVSARWLALNRGKKAVEVDIKSPAERDRLRAMAADADVFLHNWAPGKAGQLGLDHADFARVNPGLVYAYTSGWADRLPGAPMGTDFMVQARTGVGEAVRPSDESPAPSLMTLLDVLGGLLGAEAVLAGLLLRERTGRGIRVESALLGAADLLTAPARARAARQLPPRRPAAFRRPLRTADGWLAVADRDSDRVTPTPTSTTGTGTAAPGDGTSPAGTPTGAPSADKRSTTRPHAPEIAQLPTSQALEHLRDHGLTAVPVLADLRELLTSGPITRDAHGAPAVPDPWSFL
ncbi:CoA transferase [Streptomyces sp. NA04227]|uniref:CoA transferase n=1 Tax=Streptomyces sp. NA04227 TaxID=2742136 RepID=UPI00158FB0BB|nr:CoA transferase [Streptomyces sp. NA04227]QKW08086.1 CoA transferase [Streptomyces sp. NA04227]